MKPEILGRTLQSEDAYYEEEEDDGRLNRAVHVINLRCD